jgi:hypothetical protein
MKVEPAGAELLRVARETLLAQLLPQLPAQSHYAARMAANAMAIAERELEGAGGDEAAELARIVALLPECKGRELREANRRLALAVRAGRFDDPRAQQALDEHLRLATEARLAVSSPKPK